MPTYYINADTGNDSTGDGSSGNPWLTISKAHDSATDGDTIICQDSTATYSFADKTFTKGLTIQGEQADASGAVFDGGTASKKWTLGTYTIVINNITFQNIICFPGLFNAGGAVELDWTINNCVFQNIDAGIHSYTNIATGSNAAYGSVIFADCLFLDCYKTHASTLLNCSKSGGTMVFSWINCTFYFGLGLSTSSTGIFGRTSIEADSIIIKNCIAKNDSGVSMAISVNLSSVYSYSCFDGFTDTPAGTGVLNADPLLVDAANGDFRLRPTSPALATGVLV